LMNRHTMGADLFQKRLIGIRNLAAAANQNEMPCAGIGHYTGDEKPKARGATCYEVGRIRANDAAPRVTNFRWCRICSNPQYEFADVLALRHEAEGLGYAADGQCSGLDSVQFPLFEQMHNLTKTLPGDLGRFLQPQRQIDCEKRSVVPQRPQINWSVCEDVTFSEFDEAAKRFQQFHAVEQGFAGE
jgi:hypothetical protein